MAPLPPSLSAAPPPGFTGWFPAPPPASMQATPGSSEKLESARLNHLAAKEHAKATMLETYQKLIMKETSGMPEDVKAEHIMFLKCIRESIFGKTNDVKDD
ncbi:unnamed protein product [Urochloa humidicola]